MKESKLSHFFLKGKGVHIRSKRIAFRLIGIYVLTCLIPISVMGIYYYQKYSKTIVQKLGESSKEVLGLLNTNHIGELEKLEYLVNKLAYNEEVQAYLETKKNDMNELEKYQVHRDLNKLVTETMIISQRVKSVTLLDKEYNQIYSTGYNFFEKKELESIMQEALQIDPLEYISAINYGGNQKGIILAKNIKSIEQSGKSIGYMLVFISEQDFMRTTYENIYSKEQGEIILLDENGLIISTENVDYEIGKTYRDKNLIHQINEKHGEGERFFQTKVLGKEKLVAFDYNSKTRWYAIILLNKEYITAEIVMINEEMLILSVICALFGIIILSIVSFSIVIPIKRLVQFTREFGSNIDTPVIEDNATDEVAYLIENVNGMVVQIKDYVKDERENSIKRRQLELSMLQAQINPHFLFNTLNSIRWIAILSRVPTVAEAIASLANLLRNTIVEKDEKIAIKEEIENIKNYCLIQGLKYGENFRIEYEIDENIKESLILKFLLQPIVENSIIHGIGEKEKTVKILIKAEKIQQGDIQIIIEDDGKGFDKNQMESEKKRFSGIGSKNVAERIELTYGEPYGMEIISSIGRGTKVTIRIPNQRRDEDEI